MNIKSYNSEDEQHKKKLEILKQEIAQGIEELDRGEGIPATNVFVQMKEKATAIKA